MIELRPFEQLGSDHHGWLNAKHHFSFASYYDPDRMNWGRLLVWNDNIIAPNSGFPPHPHKDMEIITYVSQGAITHQDNLGNKGRTVAGDVQVMSAGTGIAHSEYNLEPGITKTFQIWIQPDQTGMPPSWGTRPFPSGASAGRFVTLASGMEGDEDALPIRCNARLVAATLQEGQSTHYAIERIRKAYLVVAQGSVKLNGKTLKAGDGAAVRDESLLDFNALEHSEIVMVDVA